MSYFPERVNTNRLLEMLDRDVGEMAEANEFFPEDDEDDE